MHEHNKIGTTVYLYTSLNLGSTVLCGTSINLVLYQSIHLILVLHLENVSKSLKSLWCTLLILYQKSL